MLVPVPEIEAWQRTQINRGGSVRVSRERWSDWRLEARKVIQRVLAETTELPAKERLKAIDDAYPFGERKYWPYRCWLDERRRIKEWL